MTKQFEQLSRSRPFDGFFKIDKITFRHSLYRGDWSPVIERELFGRGEAVIVLLYDSKAEKVVLIEQCRAGALGHAGIGTDNAQPHLAWLIEPVAGMIDKGETPLQACEREAVEEAGVTNATFEFISCFYPSPGGSDELLHLYAADIDSSNLPEYAGLEEEGEDIRIIQYRYDEAKQKLKQGDFNVASTIIALQWLFCQKLNPTF